VSVSADRGTSAALIRQRYVDSYVRGLFAVALLTALAVGAGALAVIPFKAHRPHPLQSAACLLVVLAVLAAVARNRPGAFRAFREQRLAAPGLALLVSLALAADGSVQSGVYFVGVAVIGMAAAARPRAGYAVAGVMLVATFAGLAAFGYTPAELDRRGEAGGVLAGLISLPLYAVLFHLFVVGSLRWVHEAAARAAPALPEPADFVDATAVEEEGATPSDPTPRRVADLLDQARLPLTERGREQPMLREGALSAVQAAVVQLLADGYTRPQIAAELGVADVGAVVTRALDASGATTERELVAMAVAAGIVVPGRNAPPD
jgi:hypothetical protein